MNSKGSTYPAGRPGATFRLAADSAPPRSRLALAAAVMALLGAAATPAWARIYRQVDPATGAIVYTNYRMPAQRRHIGIALPPPVPMPSVPNGNSSREAARTEEASAARPTSGGRSISSAAMDFRVSAATQRERDSERRRLLRQELNTEQAALDQAIEHKAASEVIQRYRANIEALNRELARVR